MITNPVRRAAEAMWRWADLPAEAHGPSLVHRPRPQPLLPQPPRTRPRLVYNRTDITPTRQRLTVSAGDPTTVDVDALVEVARPRPISETESDNGDGICVTRGGGSRAKWVFRVAPDAAANPTIGESERLASMFRAVFRRAADIGVVSLGLPVVHGGYPGAAQRNARIAVREARAWCRINARPAMIAFCVRDAGLVPLYRDLIASA
jgi:O-acetyl-ADP-ribose deacetylase (regulator of RNase III)